MSAEVNHCRAIVATLSRWHVPDAAALTEARRNLRAAMARDYLTRLRNAVPPLSPEQLAELRALLR